MQSSKVEVGLGRAQNSEVSGAGMQGGSEGLDVGPLGRSVTLAFIASGVAVWEHDHGQQQEMQQWPFSSVFPRVFGEGKGKKNEPPTKGNRAP